MLKSTQILLSVILLSVVSQACTLTGISTPDSNSINTAIAQTIAVALTQTPQGIIPITGLESPIPTFTQEPPTFTPTETLTLMPVFTPTPLTPQISVSMPTNCRTGPGKVYDRVGALLVGEIAEVVGRDPTGNYWYIRNPDQSNGFCWLWGEYATLTGNISVLPVYTPPPTPTPSSGFEAYYAHIDTCRGWWVEMELENTGGISFKSISFTVRDTVTDTVFSTYADGFSNINGCLTSNTKDTLPPGATYTVSSPTFIYDPTGHKLRATITLCSSPGLNGMCVTQVINFTP